MRFLSNTYDPSKPDARQMVGRVVGETEEETWRRYQSWIKGKIIARPKATAHYTVEQLEEMGMVGVYYADE